MGEIIIRNILKQFGQALGVVAEGMGAVFRTGIVSRYL
jgi:hypothetical protein